MSSELKLDEGLCRCCHAQGMFQNLSTPFVCQGQEEIYSEMLRECFNVVITPLEGEYSTSTYTICITCALKLRDANEFKKQVLECEERFKEVCKEVMKSLEPMDIDIKLEIDITGDQSIKEEPSFDDMDTGAEENYEVKSEEQKNNLDTTIKRTQTDDSKGKGRKLRVTSNKGKPAVKVKRQNRVGIPRRQKKSSNDGAANETDSTKNKTETVTGTRKKIADKKTLVDKSYKKGDDPKKEPYYSIIEEENITVYSCLSCDKGFKSRRGISQHHRYVHLKMRPKARKCRRCDARVPEYLKAYHLERDHGVPAPECGVCGKKFPYPHLLLKHQKAMHMGEKNERCHVCDMQFFYKAQLKKHMAKHAGSRNHKCQYCGKCFVWDKNLKIHQRIHTDDRRHRCDVCDKAFVQYASLKYHLNRHHPEMRVSRKACSS